MTEASLRVFEYGFHHAIDNRQDDSFHLDSPEPVIIYLVDSPRIPLKSTLHIKFQGQRALHYHVKGFICPRYTLKELARKKLIFLIPFQVLRLRAILYGRDGQIKYPSKEEFKQL